MIALEDVAAARKVIADKLHRTPLFTSKTLGEMAEIQLHLKAELLQKTGSFKPRGVLNKIAHLTPDEKRRGLIAVSSGNHAQAVAYGADIHGIPATVVMPQDALPSKVEATRNYGAEVILHGDVTQIFTKAEELQRERGLVMVHPFDDLHIMAGQGTIGLEILEDLPDVEAVVVPIGGGGLIAGIATAFKLKKSDVRVIGVEPEGAAAMYRSLKDGRPARLGKVETIADGLAAPFAGALTFEHIRRYVDEIVLVKDGDLVEAMGLLLERCKLLVEPAGAASVAALLSGKLRLTQGTKTVCVLSGGNISLERLVAAHVRAD